MSADTPPVVVTAQFQSKPGRVDQLRSLLQTLVAPTRAEAGCLRYDLHESSDQSGSFVFLEAWRNESDLERHLASSHIRKFREHVPDLVASPAVIQLWRQIG